VAFNIAFHEFNVSVISMICFGSGSFRKSKSMLLMWEVIMSLLSCLVMILVAINNISSLESLRKFMI